jgi:hypothetical protein
MLHVHATVKEVLITTNEIQNPKNPEIRNGNPKYL